MKRTVLFLLLFLTQLSACSFNTQESIYDKIKEHEDWICDLEDCTITYMFDHDEVIVEYDSNTDNFIFYIKLEGIVEYSRNVYSIDSKVIKIYYTPAMSSPDISCEYNFENLNCDFSLPDTETGASYEELVLLVLDEIKRISE